MSVRSARYNTLSLRTPKGTTALPRERDAWRFLDAAGITSSRQQEAIITLVRDLKQANLWTKMKAVYPFVGGTATTHKWNLKDPQDTDAAFRLSFSGGWTHSSTGALPNGTNGYADTFFSPLNDYTSQNTGNYGVYLRTNNTTAAVDIGNWTTASGYNYLYTYISGASRDYRLNDNGNVLRISNVTRTDGLFTASRRSSSDIEGYRNGVSEGTASHGTETRQNITMTISALKGFGSPAGLYSNREVAFAHIGGDGLTDSEATLLFNCVDRYQKFLGRAV